MTWRRYSAEACIVAERLDGRSRRLAPPSCAALGVDRAGRRAASSTSVGRSVDGAEAEPRLGDQAVLDAERAGDHGEREVAVALRELLERVAPARSTQPASVVCVTSSPGSSAVVKCVTKNSLGRQLAPPGTRLRHDRPPSATRTTGSSAPPSACAIEPPTVPRFRVTKWPM